MPTSSVRSYLSLNTPETFERVGRGRYRLQSSTLLEHHTKAEGKALTIGKAKLYQDDCFDWLASQKPRSIQAVVTDPPMAWLNTRPKKLQNYEPATRGNLAYSSVV